MAHSRQGQLYRDSRWICIQVEQQLNRCLAPKGITAVQANILLYILRQGGQGVSLTDIHRTWVLHGHPFQHGQAAAGKGVHPGRALPGG